MRVFYRFPAWLFGRYDGCESGDGTCNWCGGLGWCGGVGVVVLVWWSSPRFRDCGLKV